MEFQQILGLFFKNSSIKVSRLKNSYFWWGTSLTIFEYIILERESKEKSSLNNIPGNSRTNLGIKWKMGQELSPSGMLEENKSKSTNSKISWKKYLSEKEKKCYEDEQIDPKPTDAENAWVILTYKKDLARQWWNCRAFFHQYTEWCSSNWNE